MTESKGHFEKGRWVEDPQPPVQAAGAKVIDERLADATKSVLSSIDAVIGVTRDLVTTEEGKQYIDKTLRDTQTQVKRSFDDILSRIKTELDKAAKNKK